MGERSGVAVAGLTAKQQRFIEEYLIDLNATQAAIRAGYSEKTANQQGARLLTNVGVAAAVAAAQAERSERTAITADRVIEEMARIAFSDMGEFADWSANRVSLKDSSEVDTRCVLEVKQSSKEFGNDVGIKLYDKVAALKLLGQHLGIFVDRQEHSGPNGGPIPFEVEVTTLSETERAAKITALLDAARRRAEEAGANARDR